ncbi:MAG TPA: hypothetical protein VJ838_12325 [Gaiellaceae bacterium]|nr:hypothetical protein [Gaiellaceae bacterium]
MAALAISGGVAYAVFPNDSVTHFTGCLNTSASPGGTFVNVALGETPSKACGKGQILAHLSGGDITNVQTASGSGLTGGTDNGAASLALDSTGCSSGGLLKWNGSTWACGVDENAGGTITGVTAGTGLTGGGTSGNVSVALDGSYQLPQSGCASGQVVKSDGSGGWSCQDDIAGGSDLYYDSTDASQELPRPTGGDSDPNFGEKVAIAQKFLPAGTYLLLAKTDLVNTAGNTTDWECDLENSTGAELDYTDILSKSFDTNPGPITLTAVYQQPEPGGKVDFRCQVRTDGGATASATRLTAIKIATLH